MLWLTLVLASSRQLSADELAAARLVADAGTPVIEQAFATEDEALAESVWFVPFVSAGAFRGLVFAPPHPHTVASPGVDCSTYHPGEPSEPSTPQPVLLGAMEFTPAAGARFTKVTGVTFADIDQDGLVDVVVIGATQQGAQAPTPRAFIALASSSGAYREDRGLEDQANALGGTMTLKKIVERLRPPPMTGVEVSCQRLNVPLAVSEDGVWALVWSQDQQPPRVVSLETGAAPPWMTDRLAEAVSRVTFGCSWHEDEGAMHGGSSQCSDPIQALNDRLAGVKNAPVFVPLDRVAKLLALGRGDSLVLPQSVGAVGAGWLRLPPACRDGLVRAVLPSRHGAVVLVAPANTVVTEQLYQAPESAVDCICGGGTCVHDIVDEPAPKPVVSVVFLKPTRR